MGSKNSSLVLKIFILLAKLNKPLLRKLLSLKKMKLLEHYSYYSYSREYDFSPSTTPLIHFPRMSKNGRISLKKLYSELVVICRSFLGNRKKEMYSFEMDLNLNMNSNSNSLVCGEEFAAEIMGEDDDECVDAGREVYSEILSRDEKAKE